MELWLLGAGAIVLIAITVWIVWPATSRSEEGSSMQDTNRLNLPPQGDRFEDQYTAATADLSVGGVAGAVGAMQSEPTGTSQPGQPVPGTAAAGEPWSSPTLAREGVPPAMASSVPSQTGSRPLSLSEPRTLGVGAGLVLTAGGALGGAWLYSRWLERRNRPINRLRRGARDVASRIGERLPENVDLPEAAAPVGGVASAVLLSTLILARALRREEPRSQVAATQARGMLQDFIETTRQQTPVAAELSRRLLAELRDTAREQTPVATDMSRKLLKELMATSRKQAERMPPPKQLRGEQKRVGIGLGGMAAIGAASFIVWRLLRGGGSAQAQQPWYVGMGAPGI